MYSSSEAQTSYDEDEVAYIAYKSESGNNNKSSNISIDRKEDNWNNGCRDGFIIDLKKL